MARQSGARLRDATLVLVVDDDADVRAAMRLTLVDAGFEVVEAADGETALELLASAADGKRPLPDVVLLDFAMPGFSGIGILRFMRTFETRPATILVTGFPDPHLEAMARAGGAVAVLRKPLDDDALRQAVLAAAVGSGVRARADAARRAR